MDQERLANEPETIRMKLLIPPPLIGLVTAAAMWIVARNAVSFQVEQPLIEHLSLGVIAVGIGIELVCVFQFFRAKTTVNPLNPDQASSLVITGFYRYTRNPMYLGLLILLLGWGLRLSNPLALLPILLFVAYMTVFQIKPEEEALKRKFGDPYLEYCARVRRWL